MEPSKSKQQTSKEQRRTNKGKEARCSNCDRKFTKDCLPTRQFYYEFYEDGVLMKKHVLIRDAIKEIYQWRLFGLSEKEAEETFGSLQIRVCGSICGIAIAKLYGAIKVFDSLTNASSELHFLTKKMLDSFMGYASQCVRGEPSDKTKLPANVLGRSIKGRKEENRIGLHILNRPVTQHLKLEKGDGGPCFGGEGMTTVQNPKENPVRGANDPVEPTEFQNAMAERIEKENRDDGDDYNYNSGGEYEENEEVDAGEMEEEEPSPSKKYTGNRPFLCQLCGAGLTSRQGLRMHLLLTHHVGNKEKVFVCEHCGKEFFFDYLLQNHLIRHVVTRDYPCTTCDLKFKGKRSLTQHQRDVHGGEEKRFFCNLCPNKSFKHHRTLSDHKKSIHGVKGKKILFKCKYGCGSTSNRHRSMLAHYRTRCLKRPMENQPELDLELAVESIGGDPGKEIREEDLEKMDDGGKRRKIYSCLWDCGKTFTDKGYREKHCKRVCRKRPTLKNPFPRTSQQTRKKLIVSTNPATGSSFVEWEGEKVRPGLVPEDKDAPTPEPIEVETVFDEMTAML